MNKRKRIGQDHPLFKIGKTLDTLGYVVLCSKIWGEDKGRREHRVVMERHLGRKLMTDEIVHHKNGNRLDNSLVNLEVMTRLQHNREHHGQGQDLICKKCGFIKWYSPSVLAKLARTPEEYLCRKCAPHWTASRKSSALK